MRAAAAAVALGTAVSSALGETVLPEDVVNSVVAGAECLLWFGGGCSAIRDRELCLASKDGAATRQQNGVKVFGEPCLWCGGGNCTADSDALCAPLTLVTGQVSSTAQMANCSYAKALEGEAWDKKIAGELVTPNAVQHNLSFSKVKTPGQVSGGQACRASTITDTHDPDGVGRNYYAVWTANTLQECFDICSYAKDCTGVEFEAAANYCEVWHMPISWTQAEDGFQCFRASAQSGADYDPQGFWDGEKGVVESSMRGQTSSFLAKKVGAVVSADTSVNETALEAAAASMKQRSAPEAEAAAPEEKEAAVLEAAPLQGAPTWIPIVIMVLLLLCGAAGAYLWFSSGDKKDKKHKKRGAKLEQAKRDIEGSKDAAADELQPLVQANDASTASITERGAPSVGVATGAPNWFQPMSGLLPGAQAWMPGAWGSQQPRYELLAVSPEQEQQMYQQQTNPGFLSQQLQWLTNYDQWQQSQQAQQVATLPPGTAGVQMTSMGGVPAMATGTVQLGTGAVPPSTGYLQPATRELQLGSAAPAATYGGIVHMQQATQCPACGNMYATDSVFCRKCGRKRDEVPGSYTVLG